MNPDAACSAASCRADLPSLFFLTLTSSPRAWRPFASAGGEHDVEAHAGLGDPAVGDVEAAGGDLGRLRSGHVRRVHVQGAGIIVDGVRADGNEHREHHAERGDTEDEAIVE